MPNVCKTINKSMSQAKVYGEVEMQIAIYRNYNSAGNILQVSQFETDA